MGGDGTDQAIKAGKDWDRALKKQLKLAEKLESLMRRLENTPDGEHYVASITFKLQSEEYNQCLAIIRCNTPGGRMIAFHGDDSLAACLVGIENRMANGQLKWKVDVPYDERGT